MLFLCPGAWMKGVGKYKFWTGAGFISTRIKDWAL